jgi:hypothetical protein
MVNNASSLRPDVMFTIPRSRHVSEPSRPPTPRAPRHRGIHPSCATPAGGAVVADDALQHGLLAGVLGGPGPLPAPRPHPLQRPRSVPALFSPCDALTRLEKLVLSSWLYQPCTCPDLILCNGPRPSPPPSSFVEFLCGKEAACESGLSALVTTLETLPTGAPTSSSATAPVRPLSEP